MSIDELIEHWSCGEIDPDDKIEHLLMTQRQLCALELKRVLREQSSTSVCHDPYCGCQDPAFLEPIEALRFLSHRFKHAGVSAAVAKYYARDIDAILASYE